MNEQTPIDVLHLGQSSYGEVWELQKELQQKLIAGTGHDTLILCEHPPTITLGKSAKRENIIASNLLLQKEKVGVHEIERGGDVTYHGPGQLVCYPIIDLRKKKTDVGWYLRSLEEVIINTLQEFDITGVRIEGKTGVWTPCGQRDTDQEMKKIASLGVRLSRWCTLHGLSLNVADCREGFSLIYPCGMSDIEITSITQESASTITVEDVARRMERIFCEVFKYRSSSYGKNPCKEESTGKEKVSSQAKENWDKKNRCQEDHREESFKEKGQEESLFKKENNQDTNQIKKHVA